MFHFVYVLRSLKDNKRYIGLTNNLNRRIFQHNSGKVSSTRGRLALELIYSEKHSDRYVAASREKYLKSGTGRKFLEQMNL